MTAIEENIGLVVPGAALARAAALIPAGQELDVDVLLCRAPSSMLWMLRRRGPLARCCDSVVSPVWMALPRMWCSVRNSAGGRS